MFREKDVRIGLVTSAYHMKTSPDSLNEYRRVNTSGTERLVNMATRAGVRRIIFLSTIKVNGEIYGPDVGGNFIRLLNWVNTCAIVTCVDHQKAAGETFLVSDGEDISTPQLIRMIASALGKRPGMIPFPPWLLKAIGGGYR